MVRVLLMMMIVLMMIVAVDQQIVVGCRRVVVIIVIHQDWAVTGHGAIQQLDCQLVFRCGWHDLSIAGAQSASAVAADGDICGQRVNGR